MAQAIIRKRRRVARSLAVEFDESAAARVPSAAARVPSAAPSASSADARAVAHCLDVLVKRARAKGRDRMRKRWGWDPDSPVTGAQWHWETCRAGADAPAFYASGEPARCAPEKLAAAVRRKEEDHRCQ